MKLTAKKSLRYAGRALVAGDEFEASNRDARLLRAIGKAGLPVEDEAKPIVINTAKKRTYKTRHFTTSGPESDKE